MYTQRKMDERVGDYAAMQGRWDQRPCPADLIFVFAGLPERKRYGWELFQRGFAPMLLFSVGRSEARFLRARTSVPLDGDIVSLLPIHPEKGNHIFLWIKQGSACAEVVRLPELNTFGEISALWAAIRQRGIRRVWLLSSAVHLRRIRYAVRKLHSPGHVEITLVAVPKGVSTSHKNPRWNWGQAARLLLTEWIKLAGYHIKYGVLRRHDQHDYRPFGSSVERGGTAE